MRSCSQGISIILILVVALSGCTDTGEQEGEQTGMTTETSETLRQGDLPKIDFHTHYYYDRDYLVPILEDWNMRAMSVDVFTEEDAPSREDWKAMKALRDAHSERFLLCTAFDASKIDEPDFAENVIAQLKQDIEDGAVMVKVWKNVGMVIKDESGEYIQIDDPRFQPIWDFMAEEDIPLLTHIGEPRAAWEPLDEESPHYTYYKNNPEYHNYNNDEVPSWETIMEARDRFLEKNPDLTVIGAHLGSLAYDVDEVSKRLDKYPNFYVEPAERFGDLAIQPSENVREFILEYQDRFLYGTDLRARPAARKLSDDELQEEREGIEKRLEVHWQYLTSADSLTFVRTNSSFTTPTRGLNLPQDVIEKVYFENAAQLLDLPGDNA